MAPPKVDVARLKEQVNELLAKQKLKDALAAYVQIERAEPREPRWPHRKGDLQLRMKLNADAIASYERAVDLYVDQGFAARGAALAKVILGIDPSRRDVLARVDGQAMRDIRDAQAHPAPGVPTGPTGRAPGSRTEGLGPSGDAGPSAVASAAAATDLCAAASVDDAPSARPLRPSLVDEMLAPVPPRKSFVFDAPLLEPDDAAAEDEVRFVDTDLEDALEIELEEIEEIDRDEAAEVGVEHEDGEFLLLDEDPPAIEDLVSMPMVPLFADVPKAAMHGMLDLADLVELGDGEALVRKGAPADSLYLLAEGRAEVRLPEGTAIPLAEGEVVGETCLFADMKRRADVVARGRLRALRLDRASLEVLVNQYPELGGILYDLLTRRLVANLLRQSELFTAFDPDKRAEIGRLFEVRRAPPSTVLLSTGKRADGLYVVLLGTLEATLEDGAVVQVPPGTILGEQSLLSRTPARATIVARTEAILLRLPTSKFTELASMYPAVLAHLADLASRGAFEDRARAGHTAPA